jgi:predicted PurR-regulated permease PerM
MIEPVILIITQAGAALGWTCCALTDRSKWSWILAVIWTLVFVITLASNVLHPDVVG